MESYYFYTNVYWNNITNMVVNQKFFLQKIHYHLNLYNLNLYHHFILIILINLFFTNHMIFFIMINYPQKKFVFIFQFPPQSLQTSYIKIINLSVLYLFLNKLPLEIYLKNYNIIHYHFHQFFNNLKRKVIIIFILYSLMLNIIFYSLLLY